MKTQTKLHRSSEKENDTCDPSIYTIECIKLYRKVHYVTKSYGANWGSRRQAWLKLTITNFQNQLYQQTNPSYIVIKQTNNNRNVIYWWVNSYSSYSIHNARLYNDNTLWKEADYVYSECAQEDIYNTFVNHIVYNKWYIKGSVDMNSLKNICN